MNNLELANEYSNLIRTVLDRIDLYNNKYSDSDIVKLGDFSRFTYADIVSMNFEHLPLKCSVRITYYYYDTYTDCDYNSVNIISEESVVVPDYFLANTEEEFINSLIKDIERRK